MSTFVQHNRGGNGTQVFSSGQKHRFKQDGGGVQIIDGVPTQTQDVGPGEIKFQSPKTKGSDGPRHFVQHVHGGIAFQAANMTTHYY